MPCYIPSERILKEGGYEAGWDADQGPGVPGATSNVLFYGWAAPLAPGVEDRIITAVHAEEVKQALATTDCSSIDYAEWQRGRVGSAVELPSSFSPNRRKAVEPDRPAVALLPFRPGS